MTHSSHPSKATTPWTIPFLITALVLASTLPEICLAQTTQSLPYEAGLDSLRTSLRGPVPFIISLVGIVACGAMLIFGGEISGFLRTMVFLVLVISIIVQATSLIEMLGGSWDGKAKTVGSMLPPGKHEASLVNS